jgi:NAD-dependent SIR2 family protein deacetylase
MPTVNDIKQAILDSCTIDEKNVLQTFSNLSEMSNEFVEMRNGSRHELYELLSKLIDKQPHSLKYHKMLTEILQINTIITTNYDQLFEEAYKHDLVPIIHNTHIPYSHRKRVKLYKIHGDIRYPESIVITSKDYTNFFRKTDEPVWNKVKSLLAEKTILFVGYSLADQNIDFLLDNILEQLRDHIKESFLVAPSLPEYKIAQLKNKKIEYIPMTGEELIEKIHSEVKKNNF